MAAIVLGATIGMGLFLTFQAEDGWDFVQGIALTGMAAALLLCVH